MSELTFLKRGKDIWLIMKGSICVKAVGSLKDAEDFVFKDSVRDDYLHELAEQKRSIENSLADNISQSEKLAKTIDAEMDFLNIVEKQIQAVLETL